jgi:hypothetical protein
MKRDTLIAILKVIADFLLVSLTLILAAGTVLVFPLVYAAAVAHFSTPWRERSIKGLFQFIKANGPLLLKFDLIGVGLLLGTFVNVFYLKSHLNSATYGLYALGYIALFADLILLGYGPIVMLKMNVTLRELLTDCFLLLYGNLFYSLILVGALVVYAYFSISYPWFTFIGIYFLAAADYYLSNENYKGILKKQAKKQAQGGPSHD